MREAAWDPAGGRIADAQILALPGDGRVAGRVAFDRAAALAWSLESAFAAEKCALASGLKNPGSLEEVAQATIDGVILGGPGGFAQIQPPVVFGGAKGKALEALRGVSSLAIPPRLQIQPACALHMLAVERALRLFVNGARAPGSGPVDVALDSAPGGGGGEIPPAGDVQLPIPGLPFPVPGIPLPFSQTVQRDLGAVGALILIGVLGSAAIAAYAWYRSTTEVEAIKQTAAVDTARVRLLAQAKLAADLAAQAAARGQQVDIPDVVRSLGAAELAESRYGVWIAGAGLAAAGAYGYYRWRKYKAAAAVGV